MSNPHPIELKIPDLTSYPLIQTRYDNDSFSPGVPGDTLFNREYTDDHEFGDAYFPSVLRVGIEQVTVIQILSDGTFSGLCEAIGSDYGGVEIRSKHDLKEIAERWLLEINSDGDEDEQSTLPQVEAFVMHSIHRSKHIQWGKIAELYNSSDTTQQKAILNYFKLIENRDLPKLINVHEPELDLPASLLEVFERKEINGKQYIEDSDTGALIPEHIFMGRYRVVMADSNNWMNIMFSAPTVLQAIAKGVAYLTKDTSNKYYSNMEIWGDDGRVARGEVYSEKDGKSIGKFVRFYPEDLSESADFNDYLRKVENAFAKKNTRALDRDDSFSL